MHFCLLFTYLRGVEVLSISMIQTKSSTFTNKKMFKMLNEQFISLLGMVVALIETISSLCKVGLWTKKLP